jgi:hypothetical protein
MVVSAAVAVIAIAFLAIDASFDLNSAGLARRLGAAQASVADVARAPQKLAFAVQAWVHRSSQNRPRAIE